MTEQEPAKFKIRLDDNPESQFQKESQEVMVEKLNRRLTLITILLPCMVGIILFFVYRDIQMRVGQVSDTGTTKVKTLSKDLEDRFSSLLKKHTVLQEDFTKKTTALEKTNAELDKGLKEATTAIAYIRSARRSDNKKISDDINTINNTLETLASIPRDLEKTAADMKAADDKFSRQLENFSQSLEAVKNNLIKIQADIISLASAKIDNKTLDLALKNQQEGYQKQLDRIKRDIENKILLLESKVTGVKPTATPSAKETPITPPKATVPTSPASKPASQSTPAKDTVTQKPIPKDKPDQGSTTLPKPGTFIEQDIK